jgi:hypothetical protein
MSNNFKEGAINNRKGIHLTKMSIYRNNCKTFAQIRLYSKEVLLQTQIQYHETYYLF